MQLRSHIILLFLFLIPVLGKAQETDITGLWKGTLYNDTTKLFYRYEIAISEEKKGKFSGYSHTWFIVDDKQYYGVKKVKIKKADGKIIVEDAGLIANNYPEAPPKGVRSLSVLTLEVIDSVLKLNGPFSTNRTKEYSSLTGTVSLQRKNDYWQSALIPHLQELGKVNDLSFVANDQTLAAIEADNKMLEAKRLTLQKIPEATKEKKTREIGDHPIAAKPSSVDLGRKKTVTKDSLANKELEVRTVVTKKDPGFADTKMISKQINTNFPAVDVDKRKTITQQTVYFRSDSLQLALYDNGEVDGDTVSVLMNGEIIMAKQGLSTNAIRKSIYIDRDADSVQLIMYAENLGSIAPNTGLLVVRDGKDIYEIRFSGDLQRNAAIIFKRKK